MFKHFLSGTFALALLAACGGGGGGGPTVSTPPDPQQPPPSRPPPTISDPAHHLGTARFTAHQPRVLEQIGAHHAFARGLTGRGVRIGIDDSIVDYTQTAEFGNRVKLRDADGAVLSYWRPLGDGPFGDIQPCIRFGTCEYWRGNSGGNDEALNSWVQQIVRQRGWPARDDSLFILNEYYAADGSIGQLYRWWEVPTPYPDPGAPGGSGGSHGTWVASNAAGKNHGVASEATIIPTAQNLTDDQRESAIIFGALRAWVQGLPPSVRHQLDLDLAQGERDHFRKFDIINHSWGARDTDAAITQTIEDVRWYRAYLPNTLDAIWQVGRPDAEKTIRVWAAGNDRQSYPTLGALLPYGAPEVRGHWIAVAATDPSTRAIHPHSNRCGPLPANWNAARWGPHYCITAPGVTRGLVPVPSSPGRGRTQSGFGTSFAAPLVSGSLALMMEHFRGTRGNTEIVRRMLDTADRSGRYADLETYGAGHLDLEAALSPVGALTAGGHALSRTSFQAPAAYGAIGQRAGALEIATFDEQDFPFWIPLSGLVSAGGASGSPIPTFSDARIAAPPAPGLDALSLHWTAVAGEGSAPLGDRWVMGFGETSASLAYQPHENGFGFGVSFDDAGHLGAHTSGAFGTDPRSGMVWTSRAFTHELGAGWMLKATGTAALSLPQYERDAVFRASASMMSAMTMRVGTENTGIVVEQPLRAETGTGRFQVENGRIENGERLHDEFRVPLRPDGREVRMTFRHDIAAFGGSIAMEVGGAVSAGHVPNRREANVGLAYRATW